ncbi:MAG: DUF2442 domain-containing protein [Terriglobia bacterium]|jgi:hypothetical protein
MSSLAVEVQGPRGKSVKVSDEGLAADLVDGRTIVAPLAWFPRLWHGTPQECNHFEIFGDGAYIHWPDLDEDLTVAGLLAGQRSGESPQSLKKWLDSRKTRSKRRG